MASFALALLAAGFVQGTTLTGGQVAPGTLGSTVTKGSTGLVNIVVDQPVPIIQAVVSISPAGVGPALGTIVAISVAQSNGKLLVGVQTFRRDTGANVDSDFSFKIEQIPLAF